MAAPTVQPYLSFGGRCQEALDFYAKAVGAKTEMVMHFKDSPEPTPPGMLPPGYESKVMHATFHIGDSTLHASDGCDVGATFSGITLNYSVETEAEADRAFAALVEGGTVKMPLAKTFWSPKFGMLTDRFGLDWMVMVRPAR
jgi:PhnB protein